MKFVFGAKDGVRFEVVDVADGPVGANKGQRVVVVLDVAAIDKNPFSFDFSRDVPMVNYVVFRLIS